MPELSVVLPCYNESGNLPALLSRYGALKSKIDLELILVNNGSTDQTEKVLTEALSLPENGFAKSVNVVRNIGYGHGLQAGLKEAAAPLAAVSHADLQCDPEDLARALALYRQHEKSGPCLVKGRRHGPRALADRVVTWFYNHLAAWLLGIRADINAQPKLFPRALIAELLKGPADFTFDLYVLFAAHQQQMAIVEFTAEYRTRQWGRSKLAANPWVRLKTSLNALRYIVTLWMHSN